MTTVATDSVDVSTAVASSGKRLRFSILKNTAAQGVGRILIALSRLVIAGVIVRSYGHVTFGEYALIFGILSIAEWLLDFGVTEVFVREICRDSARAPRLMRILVAAKLLQAPAAYLVLLVALLLLRYPWNIVQAALVGGVAMFFYGGVLIYRVVFRARLLMEREVTAEWISVLAMVPMIMLASHYGGGLAALFGCHVISRAIFFALSFTFGRNAVGVSPGKISWRDLRWAWSAAGAIGTIGLLVGVYEALDLLMLSKLSNLSQVAYYSAAQRLAWPVLMALASVGATLYPVAASYWPNARPEFEAACQRGLNTVVLLAGLALCPMLAGAEFFLNLLGREVTGGAAPVLRVLAVLCLVKAMTGTLGPLLYIVHAQTSALKFITAALIVKAAVLVAVAPRWGGLGVAWAAVAMELISTLAPSAVLIARYTGYRVRWGVALKTVVVLLASAGAARLIGGSNYFVAAMVAPLLFVPLAFLTGAVRVADVRLLAGGAR